MSDRGQECIIAERYRLTAKLGEGAMGAVFSAMDTRLDRTVAIKVLPPHSLDDPDAVARFQREARALAKLSHPNIIQAYDVGEDRGRHFVVMEYIEGKNLHRLLTERGPLPPARAADYICQAALGLQHAHEKGLVHRDLKPSNLLVTPDRQVKIVDLGLARFFQDQMQSPHLTRDGIGMGTPDYMPPEQFRDAHQADPRSDIYSLGCTFYQMLTGEVPFPGSSISEKCRAHEEQLPPLEEKCPDAPLGIVEIVLRMMAKDPAARYKSALDVADALSSYVASSSASSLRIKATSSWQGSPVIAPPRKSAGQRLNARLGILLGAATSLLFLGLVFVPRMFAPAPSADTADDPGGTNTTVDSTTQSGETKSRVITILNGLTVAKDGTGQFSSIREALEKVAAGQTIRVLDDAVYFDPINLNDRARHEGITLESPRQATLSLADAASDVVLIQDVPGVTIEGFRLADLARANIIIGVRVNGVRVTGRSPGVSLEGLEIGEFQSNHRAIYLDKVLVLDGEPPVWVRRCSIHGSLKTCDAGIYVGGSNVEGKAAAGMAICDNRISGTLQAIHVHHGVTDLLVAGNILFGFVQEGIGLSDLPATTNRVLVANNTVHSGAFPVRFWDNPPYKPFRPDQVELANNLIFDASFGDMVFIAMPEAGKPAGPLGANAGDVAALSANWRFHRNWRDLSANGASKHLQLSLGANDVLLDAPPSFVSRSTSSADYMRPAANSPFLKEGSWKGDPSLPKYVGAVRPSGVEPWDWNKTWNARMAPRAESTPSPDMCN